jgi:hypothetical protein
MTHDPAKRGNWTSASQAAYDLACPGRFIAQQGLPEETSAAASLGTDAHAAFSGEEVDLNASMESLVERANQTVDEICQRLFPNGVESVVNEKRYWVEIGALKHSGQADRVVIGRTQHGRGCFIPDLKSLSGRVPSSPTNLQLRDLAVLVWLDMPDAPDEIFCAIVQPLSRKEPVVTRYGIEELRVAFDEMEKRVTRSHDLNAPRISGEQCHHCRARAVCKESIAWMRSQLPAPSLSKPDAVALTLTLPLDQAVSLWENQGTIKAILEANYARLKALPDDQLASLGLRRTKGVPRITITDPNALYARLAALGVSVDDFTAIAKIPIGDLETLVRTATDLKGQKLKDRVKALVEGLVETTVSEAGIERME